MSFTVGSETYTHNAERARDITPYTKPIPAPDARSTTEGIFNVRGNIVTALSGRALLDQKPIDTQEEWRIILEIDSDQMGVSVDAVINMFSFQTDWTIEGIDQELIQGTLQHDGQLHILAAFSSSAV